MQKRSFEERDITIRDLYPHLNDEQLKEAEENLERYLELVLRIYERIQKDSQAYSALKVLTVSRQNLMMKEQRSNPHL